MAAQPEITNMALFCDFENVALGVRDAKYAQFDIKKVLERLLLKGSIVVKKAYCDWERYKEFKATMHEAAFELIEIPHVRQSGKNSADIRMVVDALDLCYTKAHVDTFVIISGDSDFSPLVSKLRENNKYVIGIGVKDSTSDLLSANCDEFIFYDDLVRAQEAKKKQAARKAPAKPASRSGEDRPKRRARKTSARKRSISSSRPSRRLIAERGSDEKIWGSMVKTDDAAAQAGVYRIVLRLSLVQGTGRGRAEAQTADGGARREIGAVHDTVAGGGLAGSFVGAGPACVVGASAPYNHGVPLAGAARETHNIKFKIKTAGGCPAASYFSCLAKKSNQKKSPPVCRPCGVPSISRK